MKLYKYLNKNVIVYTFDEKKNIDSLYWESLWDSMGGWIDDTTPKTSSFNSTVALIKKFTKPRGRILEAGCGMGQYVYKLDRLGFDVYGVDSAKKTVNKIKNKYKNLKITCQELGFLSFKEEYFDTYYAGGVIEHYWDGYDQILFEAHRLLKQDGIIIITFPFMNSVRRKNVESLPIISDKPENFYQFALDEMEVINNLTNKGFKIKKTAPRNGVKGLIESGIIKSEIILKLLKNLYISKNIFLRLLKKIFSIVFCRMGFGHSIEIVASKK